MKPIVLPKGCVNQTTKLVECRECARGHDSKCKGARTRMTAMTRSATNQWLPHGGPRLILRPIHGCHVEKVVVHVQSVATMWRCMPAKGLLSKKHTSLTRNCAFHDSFCDQSVAATWRATSHSVTNQWLPRGGSARPRPISGCHVEAHAPERLAFQEAHNKFDGKLCAQKMGLASSFGETEKDQRAHGSKLSTAHLGPLFRFHVSHACAVCFWLHRLDPRQHCLPQECRIAIA